MIDRGIHLGAKTSMFHRSPFQVPATPSLMVVGILASYIENSVAKAKKRKRKRKEKLRRQETLPISIKEKETYWLRRDVSPLHHKATKQEVLMGIWRITISARLQSLAVRTLVFNSKSSVAKQLIENIP
eukprot:697964-Pelagomonas_calceolata.AAC.1